LYELPRNELNDASYDELNTCPCIFNQILNLEKDRALGDSITYELSVSLQVRQIKEVEHIITKAFIGLSELLGAVHAHAQRC
jgi:hypothetical protein